MLCLQYLHWKFLPIQQKSFQCYCKKQIAQSSTWNLSVLRHHKFTICVCVQLIFWLKCDKTILIVTIINECYNVAWHVTYLNLGTTFHTTENSASGECVTPPPCHKAQSTLRNSSTTDLQWFTRILQLITLLIKAMGFYFILAPQEQYY